MKFKKLVGFVALAIAGLAFFASATPALAAGKKTGGGGVSGSGWTANGMIGSAYGNAGTSIEVGNITGSSLAEWISGFTTWALGLAIAAFVLKIVLTAIDRMIFSKSVGGGSSSPVGGGGMGKSGGSDDGVLSRIPFIGAYPADTPWKEIFVHFGKQVAIVAGAWVLVNIIVNVVLFVFGTLTHSS